MLPHLVKLTLALTSSPTLYFPFNKKKFIWLLNTFNQIQHHTNTTTTTNNNSNNTHTHLTHCKWKCLVVHMKRLGFFQGHLLMDSKSLALFTPSKPMCNWLFLTPSKPVCNLLFLTPSKPVCNLLFLTPSKPVWLYEGHWWWMLTGLGFKVFAACLTSEGADKLQGACSDRVTTLLLDVTEEKSIAAARNFVESRLPAGTGQTHQSVSQCFVLCLFIIPSWIASRHRSDPPVSVLYCVCSL